MKSFSGYWVGEFEGTNQGGFAMTVEQNGDRISGSGRFSEPRLGSYGYDVTGTINYPNVSMSLAPKPGNNPLLRLGIIEVSGQIDDQGKLRGRWRSLIGTEGIFTAHQ